jgi:hypothetical protein
MATSTDGHLLKTVSTPLNRLITEGYVPDENNQWDLVNVGFLLGKLSVLQGGVDADLLALFTMLSDAMGVKMVFQNVALTGLSTLPDLPTYALKNRERVLLIAQTDSTQNGFYEWQTGGTLVRLYDWRDIVAGNGIAINGKNIAVKLLEYLLVPDRTDNFLQVDVNGKLFARIANDAVGLKLNANKELYIDGAELGGGGGGVSSLDVPHPDIHGVSGDDVLTPSDIAVFQINGGNFRRDASVLCDGFTIVDFFDRRSNLISMNVQATNLIGIHDVLVKHLTLDSEDSGKHKFTVLGAAIIDTVSPKAKRGFTTVLTVTGEGFALLSIFAANNVGITINLLNVANRFLVTVEVTVANGVNSGLYNLVCTNAQGIFSFTSGTSGNNKLEIFGDPFVSPRPTIIYNIEDLELGKVKYVDILGYDLTDEITINPSGINIFSVSGSSTSKTLFTVSDTNIADIGIKNVFVNDSINGGDSGTTGDGLLALNYAYEPAVIRVPAVFRAYGGASIGDWLITVNSGSVTIERTGGSGMAYLEATDLFFVASLLRPFTLGHGASYLNFTIETALGDFPANDGTNGVFVCIAPIGIDITNPQILSQVDCFWRISTGNVGVYRMSYATGDFTENTNANDLSIFMQGESFNNRTAFTALQNNSLLGFAQLFKTYTSHANKAVHIAMSGNFKLNFHIKGWIGE